MDDLVYTVQHLDELAEMNPLLDQLGTDRISRAGKIAV